MARGAVVVILSDGWERGEPTLVGRRWAAGPAGAPHRVGEPAGQRDARSRVRAGGMVAAMPYCDALVSGHSFAGAGRGGRGDRRRRDAPPAGGRGAEPVDEAEPWASATPVPGSSVAMPSGHGPSKGNTTPGWVTDE